MVIQEENEKALRLLVCVGLKKLRIIAVG